MPLPEILLIDDDVWASVLRKRVLETRGYRVQIALDSYSGLALADALKPALVLFDHTIPGDITGPQLMAALRLLLPETPLVSLSGHEAIDGLYSPMPTAFITKGNYVRGMLDTIASLAPME